MDEAGIFEWEYFSIKKGTVLIFTFTVLNLA
jgi:hypothetical protein